MKPFDKIFKGRETTVLLKEDDILGIFTQLCLGVKHCHDRKVVHRGITIENVYLTKEGQVKLCNFEDSYIFISKIGQDEAQTTKFKKGPNTSYLAPEAEDVEEYVFGFENDIWCLGIVLYELCTLKEPFFGYRQRYVNLFRNIKNEIETY